MSDEWVICLRCTLKFRLRERTCPRCETPADAAQVRWSEQRGPASPEEGSGLALAVPVGVLMAAGSSFLVLVTFGGAAAGQLSAALVIAGLLAICVSWAWSLVLAWREGVPSFFFALLAPFLAVLLKKQWKTALPKLGGAALIAAGGFFAPPGFFHTTTETRIARLCERRQGEDCSCVGVKAVVLMTPEDREAEFDPESPALRALMLTATQLCLKGRLVERCVQGRQGSELQCICLIDRAINAFTPAEVDAILAGGRDPAKYSAMRAECTKR